MTRFQISRRHFLEGAAATTLLAAKANPQEAVRRPKIAVVFTVLRFRSHAFNILENLFGAYLFNGTRQPPRVDVVSLHADQFPADDMAREVSKRLRVPLYATLEEALCLGGRSLAVDGVLAIGEHGEYPYNELGQHLYPRKQFFDQALAVMQRSGRFVPYFNDKHLSYRWDWALEMYDAARRHKMPMMAGSSVPLAERRPSLELPEDAEIEEAIAIHGGGFESYDFHGFELLQSLVESRRGGESGIAAIEFLAGDAYAKAKDRRWSESLVAAALAAESKMEARRQPRPTAGVFAPPQEPRRNLPHPRSPYAISISYQDGLRGTVFSLSGGSDRWLFACRIRGESQPRATALYNGPWGNRCLFMALTHAIEELYLNGREPYPVERTLLTTGALEAAVRSYHDKRRVETPHLVRRYQSGNWNPLREQGASWRLIDPAKTQPVTIDPNRFG